MMRWNRREVYAGNSNQEFNRILNILANERIKYFWDKVNRLDFTRAFTAPGPVDTSANDMYYIYVHKKDVDQVHFLIRQ